MTRRHTRFFYRRLRGAVESGHCIRITYNGGINDGYNFPADNVEISADESVIGAMAVWHVSQEMVSSPDRYNFQVLYINCSTISTNTQHGESTLNQRRPNIGTLNQS